jgi:hypothetical protein
LFCERILARQRTGNVTAENISAFAIRARSAKNAALKSRVPRCAGNAWVILSLPLRFPTSGILKASRPAWDLSSTSPRAYWKRCFISRVYCDRPGDTPLIRKQIRLRQRVPRHAITKSTRTNFRVGMGAEAIKELLAQRIYRIFRTASQSLKAELEATGQKSYA